MIKLPSHFLDQMSYVCHCFWMATEAFDQKLAGLRELAREIGSHEDWWLFPTQEPIQGFMGTGQIFIVGDQPSTDEWGPKHPNRKIFYERLHKAGLQNAHLTDLYKRRDFAGALERLIPDDFLEHVNLFKKEIQILKPTLIVGLGQLAQRLLIQNLPDWKPMIPRIYHFAHVERVGMTSGQYETNMRKIILGE